MKPIQTSKRSRMPHFIYALIVCALIAAVGVRSGIAATTEPLEAKVTELFSKDLPECPGKEGLMITVEYPPGSVDPIHRHPGHGVYLCAGGLDRNAGQGRERSDADTWPDLL